MKRGLDRPGAAPERSLGGSLSRAASAGDALVVGRSDRGGRGGDRYRVRFSSTVAVTPDGMDANSESDAHSDDSRRGKRQRNSNRVKAAAGAAATTAAGDNAVREGGNEPPTVSSPGDSTNSSVSNKSAKKKSSKKSKAGNPKKQKASRGSSTSGGQEKDGFLSLPPRLGPTHQLSVNDQSAMMEDLLFGEGKAGEAAGEAVALPAEGTASTKKKKKPRKPRGKYGGSAGDCRSVSDDSDADSLNSTEGAAMPGFSVDQEVEEIGVVPSSPKKKGNKRRGGSRGKEKKSKDDSTGDGGGPDAASTDNLGIAAAGSVEEGVGKEGGEVVGST